MVEESKINIFNVMDELKREIKKSKNGADNMNRYEGTIKNLTG